MKWELVKLTVAKNVRARIMDLSSAYAPEILLDLVACDFAPMRGKPRHSCVQMYADAAYKRIMEFDIRCVGKLRELFTSDFPPSLSKG